MDYNEDEYLMLSGIQHFKFCRRQWALIHIEQQWEENVQTFEGRDMHRKADNAFVREKRKNKMIVRGMPIKSHELKVTGICDVVEFIEDPDGVFIEKEGKRYKVFPVEYKRGKPKSEHSDLLQMAAQAMCLEEMLVTDVPYGAIYYGEVRDRLDVAIDESLRNEVKKMITEMRDYYQRKYTPKVKTGSFCNSCSLQEVCLPKLMNKSTVRSYVERKIHE